MELFKLLGTIAIDASGANKAIDSASENVNKFADKMNEVGQKVASLGTTLTTKLSVPIVGIGAVAVKSAADVKATNSQFEQTFGEMQGKASAAMKSVADDSGILQTRLQSIGTSIYAFAKSSGADSAEALSLMETALQATADSAAYYDRSLEDTAESLQSFLKGNFENDAALGLSCTETTRNAKAMELFGQKYNDLSEIQKQQTLLKMVTDAQALSGAMGQASRESDGFENVTGNLMESLRQLAAELGEVLLPTVIKLVQNITSMVKEFSQMDASTKKLIVTIAGIVAAVGPVVTVIGKTISAVSSLVKVGSTLISGIKGVLSVGKLLATGITALSGLFSTIATFVTGTLIPAIASIGAPVLAVVAAIAAVIAIGVALIKHWDEVCSFASEVWGKITDFVSKAKDKIVGFLQKMMDFISKNWQGLALMLVNPFVGGFKLLYDNCETFRNFIDNFLGNLKDGFQNFVSNISDKASELKDKVVEKTNELKEQAVAKYEEFKNAASEKIAGIRDTAVAKFNELRERGSEAIASLKDSAMERFNEMGSTISERFTSIASGLTNTFENAKNKLSGIVETVKSFFNFDWKFPDIKLPHFKFSWNTEGTLSDIIQKLGLPGIPKIDVEWYKDGGVMTDPTIFGINGNRLMVGGEAGAEAIAPIDVLQRYIAEAVQSSNAGLLEVLSAILSLLREYMPEMTNMQLVMDTGAVVGELAEPMNEALGNIAYMRGRRN